MAPRSLTMILVKGFRFKRLPGADLPGADLPGADLTDANLTGADLTGVVGADLSGTIPILK